MGGQAGLGQGAKVRINERFEVGWGIVAETVSHEHDSGCAWLRVHGHEEAGDAHLGRLAGIHEDGQTNLVYLQVHD